MDTGSDFIKPEFLNIIFFQQKNLVIFPYIDLKHLHALEIYTAGYNVIDLESTALNNLREIIEFEVNNSYSQNPTLFFIYNVDRGNVKKIMDLNGIRCIINSNEKISDLANGSKFIFFNKKSSQFLNYNLDDSELEFETYLISTSQDEEILLEKIHQIKIAASRIFRELNQNSSLEHLPDILIDYDKKYWDSILQFTSRYYDVNIPNISNVKFKQRKQLKDFLDEYEVLISTNKPIGKEFIQLLHEYRSKKVNPQHLELEELYNPLRLYNYLRNHHWKNEIPEDFISDWTQMKISGYKLTESDQSDFEIILKQIGAQLSPSLLAPQVPASPIITKNHTISIPSLHNEWGIYKQWVLDCLTDMEQLTSATLNNNFSPEFQSYLIKEFMDLNYLIDSNSHQNRVKVNNFDLLLVDITNILNMDKNKNHKIKVDNIQKVGDAVTSLEHVPRMIADASMRHNVDDADLYEELVDDGIVIQSPAGIKADEYILEIAKVEKCKFLTNDKFEEYWKEFGKDWIFNNRLTCLFFNGKFIIRNNIKR